MTQYPRWIALLPSLCLSGCFEGLFGGPSLAGEWSGDMDCYHADWVGEFEVRLDLDRDRRPRDRERRLDRERLGDLRDRPERRRDLERRRDRDHSHHAGSSSISSGSPSASTTHW